MRYAQPPGNFDCAGFAITRDQIGNHFDVILCDFERMGLARATVNAGLPLVARQSAARSSGGPGARGGASIATGARARTVTAIHRRIIRAEISMDKLTAAL